MRYSQSIVAKKYAQAYVQEYGHLLTIQDIDAFKLVIAFLKKHHNFMSLISLLSSQLQQRHELIDTMIEHFKIPVMIARLADVLSDHKRLPLFSLVLQDICCLYVQKNNMLEVTIYSSQELSENEYKKFEQFFEKLAGKKIISNVVVDETLIAGIRMQSDVLLWEYSIAARIRQLSQRMLQEE
ncbi:F0F1 ATP synthase subunit delta [Candidatus Babeliales bacterium]|nr:F0F1 ATP synthase subunit delta [Candidatus Babeliales bacterium]